MAYNASNAIMGPGTLYIAPYGTTEPAETVAALTAAPSTPWRDVGGTMDGVQVAINQEYTALTFDQAVYAVGRRLTSAEFTVSTNLAEPTLENLRDSLNQLEGSVATTTDVKKFTPASGNSATQPNYKALLLDGFGANSVRRRVIGRKMLSTSNVEFAYSKADQSVFAVSFVGHEISPSVAPYVILEDASDEE